MEIIAFFVAGFLSAFALMAAVVWAFMRSDERDDRAYTARKITGDR